MTYLTPSGKQFLVVAAGGHRELGDKLGDYIVAFALSGHVTPPPHSPPVGPGHYRGHITLDRSRLPFDVELAIDGSIARLDFETSNPKVKGQAKGRVTEDSLVASGQWTFEAQHCSGTIDFRGVTANGGGDLIGELKYSDGCSDGRTKPGTFAVRDVSKPGVRSPSP